MCLCPGSSSPLIPRYFSHLSTCINSFIILLAILTFPFLFSFVHTYLSSNLFKNTVANTASQYLPIVEKCGGVWRPSGGQDILQISLYYLKNPLLASKRPVQWRTWPSIPLFVCYTVKKVLAIFPSPRDVTNQTLESLVSDIPAGDGKIANLFYSVWGDTWRSSGIYNLLFFHIFLQRSVVGSKQDTACTALLKAEFFIEPPPDTQRKERQGERGTGVAKSCYLSHASPPLPPPPPPSHRASVAPPAATLSG